MLSRAVCTFLMVGLGLPVAAATTNFSFTGTVTSNTISSPTYSFGNNGEAATIDFDLTAAAGELIPVGPVSGGLWNISVASPDFTYDYAGFTTDGFNDGFNDSITVSDTQMFIATSSGNFTWPGKTSSTLRTVLRVTYGTALGAAPTTYDQLIAAMQSAGTTARFATNGNFDFVDYSDFTEYSVVGTQTAPVPLPAGAVLLLSGLGVFALRRARH